MKNLYPYELLTQTPPASGATGGVAPILAAPDLAGSIWQGAQNDIVALEKILKERGIEAFQRAFLATLDLYKNNAEAIANSQLQFEAMQGSLGNILKVLGAALKALGVEQGQEMIDFAETNEFFKLNPENARPDASQIEALANGLSQRFSTLTPEMRQGMEAVARSSAAALAGTGAIVADVNERSGLVDGTPAPSTTSTTDRTATSAATPAIVTTAEMNTAFSSAGMTPAQQARLERDISAAGINVSDGLTATEVARANRVIAGATGLPETIRQAAIEKLELAIR